MLQTLALAWLTILCACVSDGSSRHELFASTAGLLNASPPKSLGPSHVGWRDGIGPGRPWAVPMSLDYFQGFLIQVGVPAASLPVDGRTLSPQQALGLVPLLLSTPVTLDNFAGRRMAAQAVGATYVLHMATAAGQGAGSPPPPVKGPGRWVPKNESMSEEARRYQAQVTAAPPGMVYLVERNGVVGDFDGFTPNEGPQGVLLEAKGIGYEQFFDSKLTPKPFYQGLKKLINKARNQSRVANGIPVRWHVAEPRMVAILEKIFAQEGITGIDVIYTPALP
jgi:hypothetical protein